MMEEELRTSLKYALFCRDVKTEGQDEYSIIGVRHVIEENFVWTGQETPQKEKIMRYKTCLLLGFVGLKKGSHKLYIIGARPSGELETPIPPQEFICPDTLYGIYINKVNLLFDIVENGVYSFRLTLDGEPLTEIHLPVMMH